MVNQHNDWEVLTDSGWSKFTGLKITESDVVVHLKLSDSKLSCSVGHRVMTERGWIEVQDLTVEDRCQTDSGFQQVLEVLIENKHTKLYDLVGVEQESRYYTNDILSHNCDEFAHLHPNLAGEFIASVFPTISSSQSSKLIIISTPNGLNHYHKLWVDAQNDNNDFKCVEGRWQENPNRNQTWADEQRKKLGEVKYRQEIECLWGKSIVRVRDKQTGKEIDVSFDDLYSLL